MNRRLNRCAEGKPIGRLIGGLIDGIGEMSSPNSISAVKFFLHRSREKHSETFGPNGTAMALHCFPSHLCQRARHAVRNVLFFFLNLHFISLSFSKDLIARFAFKLRFPSDYEQ